LAIGAEEQTAELSPNKNAEVATDNCRLRIFVEQIAWPDSSQQFFHHTPAHIGQAVIAPPLNARLIGVEDEIYSCDKPLCSWR
jgi:hypothetical protein